MGCWSSRINYWGNKAAEASIAHEERCDECGHFEGGSQCNDCYKCLPKIQK